MGAGFQGGCHLITWALKQRIFSVTGRSGRCGGKEEVWTWAWRAVGGFEAGGRGSWLEECGWPLTRWNGPSWKPAMVQEPQPSSCKGMNSDHKLLEQEDRLSPGASGREHSSDAIFSLIWRDPKTFLNCEIIHLCFKSLHLWQLIATKEN